MLPPLRKPSGFQWSLVKASQYLTSMKRSDMFFNYVQTNWMLNLECEGCYWFIKKVLIYYQSLQIWINPELKTSAMFTIQNILSKVPIGTGHFEASGHPNSNQNLMKFPTLISALDVHQVFDLNCSSERAYQFWKRRCANLVHPSNPPGL